MADIATFLGKTLTIILVPILQVAVYYFILFSCTMIGKSYSAKSILEKYYNIIYTQVNVHSHTIFHLALNETSQNKNYNN